MSIPAYVDIVKISPYLLTYPAICALPPRYLSWYNRYVKGRERENMESTQTPHIEQVFAEQVFAPAGESIKAL